jgi:hypothetical protein
VTVGYSSQLPDDQGPTSVSVCGGDGLAVCGGVGNRGGANAHSHSMDTVPVAVSGGVGVGLYGGVQTNVLTIDLGHPFSGWQWIDSLE